MKEEIDTKSIIIGETNLDLSLHCDCKQDYKIQDQDWPEYRYIEHGEESTCHGY